MLTESTFTEGGSPRYNYLVVPTLTIGDMIRKARELRSWNQERLGEEAKKYQLPGGSNERINKSTVSKVEKDPYSSKLGTVWRLMTALELNFAEVEKQLESPFVATSNETTVVAAVHRRRRGKRSGVG